MEIYILEPLKELRGIEIEFKYFDKKMDTSRSNKEPLLVFELCK
jgi:hypothetical protein